MNSVMDRQALARTGEEMARDYFKSQKYVVLERNYRCRLGEIDLVLKREGRLVFVEVKTRTQEIFGAPEESVGERKKKKLFQVASCYLQERKPAATDIQFDVISVMLSPEGELRGITHFDKAFEF